MKRAILVLALVLLATGATAQERPGRRGRDEIRPRMSDKVRFLQDVPYGRGGGRDLVLDLYIPREAPGPLPVIVWIHGGGWRSGSKTRCRAARMAGRGYAVASVGYRLSGEAAFPAQIHDVKAAVRWLRAKAEDYDLDPDRIGAWGSSAGGHLAALLGTSGGVAELEGSGGNPSQSSRVQAVCDWFGPADLTTMGGEAWNGGEGSPVTALLGGPVSEKAELARLASPVAHVSADDPPFLIMHGDQDPTVPVGQSRSLAAALEKAGVAVTLQVVEGAGHQFFGPRIDRQVDDFFDLHLKGERAPELVAGEIESEASGETEEFLVHLPPGYAKSDARYPVIYWLHGRGGTPRGGIPFVRTVDSLVREGKMPPVIVVLPDGKNDSMYCDAKDGSSPVESIIVGELVPHVDRTWRTVATRDARAIEGFSMGGFGAAHLGFKHPDLFGAVSIVGGALLDPSVFQKRNPASFARVFGGDLDYFSRQSPLALVTENADRIRGRTRIRMVVGQRDAILERSLEFHEKLDALDIDHGLVVVLATGHTHEKLYRETADLTAEFYRGAFGGR